MDQEQLSDSISSPDSLPINLHLLMNLSSHAIIMKYFTISGNTNPLISSISIRFSGLAFNICYPFLSNLLELEWQNSPFS